MKFPLFYSNRNLYGLYESDINDNIGFQVYLIWFYSDIASNGSALRLLVETMQLHKLLVERFVRSAQNYFTFVL